VASVGCAGILVADTFCGPMPTLPDEGQLLMIDDMPISVGGCAANVAIDLARQGIEVDVAGCLGNDVAAEGVVSALERAKVGCGRIVRSDHLPTSKTVILLVEGADRRYIHAFGANRAFSVSNIDRRWATSRSVFYLGGLFVLPGIAVDELASLLRACREAGVVTVVDVVVPQPFDGRSALERLLPHIDYFLPNRDEARAFTGFADPGDQVRSLRGLGATTVIVTCGAEGSWAGSGGRLWHAEACRFQTVDASGAGDAFAAGIITGIVRGWDLPAMLRYASALGASAARAVGTTGSVFARSQAEAYVAANPIDVKEVRWK
jgi:sugar/nucleoside kinase (ribokinase family)